LNLQVRFGFSCQKRLRHLPGGRGCLESSSPAEALRDMITQRWTTGNSVDRRGGSSARWRATTQAVRALALRRGPTAAPTCRGTWLRSSNPLLGFSQVMSEAPQGRSNEAQGRALKKVVASLSAERARQASVPSRRRTEFIPNTGCEPDLIFGWSADGKGLGLIQSAGLV